MVTRCRAHISLFSFSASERSQFIQFNCKSSNYLAAASLVEVNVRRGFGARINIARPLDPSQPYRRPNRPCKGDSLQRSIEKPTQHDVEISILPALRTSTPVCGRFFWLWWTEHRIAFDEHTFRSIKHFLFCIKMYELITAIHLRHVLRNEKRTTYSSSRLSRYKHVRRGSLTNQINGEDAITRLHVLLNHT